MYPPSLRQTSSSAANPAARRTTDVEATQDRSGNERALHDARREDCRRLLRVASQFEGDSGAGASGNLNSEAAIVDGEDLSADLR